MLSLAFLVITTFLITLITIFSNQSPGRVKFQHNKHVAEEWFASCFYFILFCMYGFRTIWYTIYSTRYGMNILMKEFTRAAVIVKFDKFCQYLKYYSFLVAFAFKLVQAHTYGNDYYNANGTFRTHYVGYKVALVSCVLISWLHMNYYLMAFDKTGPFVLTMSRIIAKDMFLFLKFYLVVTLAFACGLSLLSNDGNPDGYYGIWQLFLAFYTLVQMTANLLPTRNNISIDNVYVSNIWLSDSLITVYYWIVIIILLNLFIAMMSTTYHRYHADNAEILLTEKHNIMDSNEFSLNVMAKDTINFYRNRYSTMETYSKFNVKKRGNTFKDRFRYNFKLFEYIPDWDKLSSPKEKKEKYMLFIVDPQVDFHRGGSLAVPGADADSHRIANLINQLTDRDKLSDVFISLDSHHPDHIAHAANWRHRDDPNRKPDLFQAITFDDVNTGEWVPRDDSRESLDWVKEYTHTLKRQDKFTLTIWPEHCIVGTPGHAVVPVINEAVQRWEDISCGSIKYIRKGSNNRTEFYSALSADVKDPNDPSTHFDKKLLAKLETCDKLLICGQASSHCVNHTLRDLMSHWHGEPSRIVYLEDCASPVAGFQLKSEELKRDALAHGVIVTTSTQLLSDTNP
eukprot:gene11683-15644_t